MIAKKNVLVLGAGVSGLTSALCLARRGFGVTVVAENFAPRVTSVVAGALWEWPPAVCGYHQDHASLVRSKVWCMASYEVFAKLARDPGTGVFLRTATFYFKQPIENSQQHFEKMNDLKGHVEEFVHDPAIISRNNVNRACGVCDAYSHLAPMIDTDVYMRWLLGEVEQAGCKVLRQRVSGNLKEQEAELCKQFRADAVVNCTGLGARELANEHMYPLRGALIRVHNDGKKMPRITAAHCVSRDEESTEQTMVFIVPRGDNMLILGGLTEPDEWDLEIGLHNYQPIQTMYRRCTDFLPMLKDAEIDKAEPVRVGLRPLRKKNVRLEHEPGTRIIHNYGHGGSGVTFSWGCAAEVADLVEATV